MLFGAVLKTQQPYRPLSEKNTGVLPVKNLRPAVYKYGLNLSSFVVIDQEVGQHESFADIFLKHNISYKDISYFVKHSSNQFNCHKLHAGNHYTVLGTNTDTGFIPQKLIYDENKASYVEFNLGDSLYIRKGQNTIVRKHRELAGLIDGSLYETLDALNVPSVMAMKLAEVFACTIDFYKLQKGDCFKIIYDQDYVEGQPLSPGEIQACVFTSGGKDYYAFYYEKEKKIAYYDQNGNSMRRQFLKAPLKFFRISSKYSLNRFHPVTKEWRAHLGTDYAAAPGTPIMATADGTVEEARFGEFNGNYVKIRHNGQYKTQYLHMSKIARGVHPGKRVKQGEVIGYVGSTGLATGPHVCYRFWKDGQQVDPFQQKLQYSEPMAKKYKGAYLAHIHPLIKDLDLLQYPVNTPQKWAETECNKDALSNIIGIFAQPESSALNLIRREKTND